PHHLLIDIIEDAQARVGEASGIPSRLAGAVLFDTGSSSFVAVSARSVVLATGGMGGLYGRHLVGGDCLGSAQAVSLAHGEKLVNIEFLQLMSTVMTPRGPVVFNEKCFRFSDLSVDVPDGLLDQRSTYGPFTSRLASRAVDLAIAEAGAPVTVRVDRLPDPAPEFIGTYRSWYEDATGLRIGDPVELFHSAHASNGGIAIATDGSCALPGLFAAGECAGGMHGADRIGGLASASALVFGRKAGHFAMIHALGEVDVPVEVDVALEKAPNLEAVGAELGAVLDEHALVVRTEEGLAHAERTMADLSSRLGRTEPGSQEETALTLLQRQRVLSARALVSAMRARTESRGAHFRADHQAEDPAQARPNAVTLGSDGSFTIAPAEHLEGSRMDNRSINP
ncbi:MAG: FAD-binding protein, partial [Coriobacteriaceae bacterium]|nr:FAD-binding protein [Coriobacteriaceae bacterium]